MAKSIARIALEVLSLLVLLGTLAFLILYWENIPELVPNRFNGAGEIVSLADRRLLFAMPAVMAVVFVAMFFPKTVQFRSLGRSVRVPAPPLLFPAMKLGLLAGFSYLTVCSAMVRQTGAWFLPVFLAAVLLPMLATLPAALSQLKQ